MTDYRTRIYSHYVRAHGQSLAPESVEDLTPRAAMLRKIIRTHFPGDRSAAILDLGCGHGAFIHFIQEAGYVNVIGVDRSSEQVIEAKRLGVKGVYEGDLMEGLKSLQDESQDVIIAFDVIEHFKKEELLPFIDEVFRVLKPGGKWIVHTPNGESPFFGRIRYGDYTHELTFTQSSIIQILKVSGFEQVECFEDIPIPHGFKSGVRWVLWKLIRGILRLYLAIETGAGKRSCIFSQNFLTVAVK